MRIMFAGRRSGVFLALVGLVVVGSTAITIAVQFEPPRERKSPTETVQLQEVQVEVFGTEARHPGGVVQGVNAPVKRVSIFVEMNPRAFRRAAHRDAVKAFAAQQGAVVAFEYKIVLPNVMNLRNLPQAAVGAIAQMPGVVRVEADREVKAHLHNSVPLIRGLQSQITGAGLSADGTGVRVCVIDTGIDSDHSMYAGRIDVAAGFDFVNNDNNPEDDNGHGSHVAGIVLGRTGLTVDFACPGPVPFQGVAPNATLIGVKVLDASGSGAFSSVIAGMDHCASPTLPGGRADVINLSLGGGAFTGNCDTDIAAMAANNAVAAGVVVVSSSGNDGNVNAMGTPACASSVISVGAYYDDDFPNCEQPTQNSFTWCLDSFCISTCTDNTPAAESLVCFSNQSDFLDVAAPGCTIQSASTAVGGTQITSMCGTSQASPHVAGLAALILSADPTLTPSQVRQVIRDGAVDLGPVGFDRGYGFGAIDVINSLSLVTPPAGCTVDAECDDGLACNGMETCNVATGVCQAGISIDCNDGIVCTIDMCVDPAGTCSNTPDDGQCNDGNACTSDVCDVLAGGCVNDPLTPCCGDGVCDLGENCNSCSADCISGAAINPACGNGICEPFNRENCKRCPEDCAGDEKGAFCCSNGEDGEVPVGCDDPRCNSGGFACSDTPATGSCCGDAICEGVEENVNCAVDCGPPSFCGDGFCDPGEDECNCPQDCGAAPLSELNCTDGVDNDCDGLTDCNDGDCSGDPACVVPVCGDLTCDANEDQCNCPQDCGAPPATETNCSDGNDNDCDGFTDCDDTNCVNDPACTAACKEKGEPCTTGAECCGGRCRDKKGSLICD